MGWVDQPGSRRSENRSEATPKWRCLDEMRARQTARGPHIEQARAAAERRGERDLLPIERRRAHRQSERGDIERITGSARPDRSRGVPLLQRADTGEHLARTECANQSRAIGRTDLACKPARREQ